MTEQEIRAKIRTLMVDTLAAKGLVQDDVQDNLNLTQSGVLDSFALMEILALAEDEFGVQLDFDELSVEEFTTLNGMGKAFSKVMVI